MPLPDPTPRKLMHTRQIQCCGYQREDGLWDLEARMVDTRTFDFPNKDRGGEIKAGEAVHDMWLRLTLDRDLLIHDVEACTDWSPFKICPQIASSYKRLIGLRITPGWNRQLKKLIGGIEGCTHLTELLGPLATTAYQTMFPQWRKEQKPKPRSLKRPRILNSCYAWSSDGEMVREQWPKFYTGADKPQGG